MIDFDANEIANWAGLPDAPHLFPRLLGKLILATVPAASFIDMPTVAPLDGTLLATMAALDF